MALAKPVRPISRKLELGKPAEGCEGFFEDRMADMTTESAPNGFFEWRTKENEIYWGKIRDLS